MTGVFGRDLAFDLLIHNENAMDALDRDTRNDARKALGMAPEKDCTGCGRKMFPHLCYNCND